MDYWTRLGELTSLNRLIRVEKIQLARGYWDRFDEFTRLMRIKKMLDKAFKEAA